MTPQEFSAKWADNELKESTPQLRVRLLEKFELVEDARGRAVVLLDASPEWLSDTDRRLLKAFVTFYAESR